MKNVSFKNRTWNVTSHLHLPVNFDESKKYPAIVCAHPGNHILKHSVHTHTLFF
jgi:dipeptidyl aminopeptidase/acylaminoacyl peptidase